MNLLKLWNRNYKFLWLFWHCPFYPNLFKRFLQLNGMNIVALEVLEEGVHDPWVVPQDNERRQRHSTPYELLAIHELCKKNERWHLHPVLEHLPRFEWLKVSVWQTVHRQPVVFKTFWLSLIQLKHTSFIGFWLFEACWFWIKFRCCELSKLMFHF